MAPGVEVLEQRLKSFVSQLQAEFGILNRIIYKYKNQHRRSRNFQYLQKVKRDLKLLHSIRIEDLLDSCFYIITGRKPKQMANLLETLKKSNRNTRKFNFMERLLGAGRLLSEMVEPMLKAAIEISTTLLGLSFFKGFSMMVLAVLGRLRVLVQQMLLDVVSVFNEVYSIAQKKQSIKITQDGIEVFREYYPAMEEVVTLECVWKTDKFVLVETKIRNQDRCLGGEQSPLETCTQYQCARAYLGENEFDSKGTSTDSDGEERISKRIRLESPATLCTITDQAEHIQSPSEPGNVSENVVQQSENTAAEGSLLSNSSTVSNTLNKRVAFISVQKPIPSASSAATFQVDKREVQGYDSKENPLFSLFDVEEPKGSLL